MATNIVHGPECSRTWANGTGSAVASGDVVKFGPALLGIALVDIANGATGSVALECAATVPKVSGAVITLGETLTWDISAGAFDDNAATPATGDVTGATAYALEAAGNGVTSMLVQFTGVPGTVN
jgi:predicted RecA/RadA family phage recombinase